MMHYPFLQICNREMNSENAVADHYRSGNHQKVKKWDCSQRFCCIFEVFINCRNISPLLLQMANIVFLLFFLYHNSVFEGRPEFVLGCIIDF